MEVWTERIEEILDRAPTRAMPFSCLLKALIDQGADPHGREELILKRITEKPGTFRVIPGRLGPWAYQPHREGCTAPVPTPPARVCDPWILSRSVPNQNLGSEGRAWGRVQESLQAWGQELDTGSQAAVARWIGANWEAERALAPFLTGRIGRK
jgi:hypothetical protein